MTEVTVRFEMGMINYNDKKTGAPKTFEVIEMVLPNGGRLQLPKITDFNANAIVYIRSLMAQAPVTPTT